MARCHVGIAENDPVFAGPIVAYDSEQSRWESKPELFGLDTASYRHDKVSELMCEDKCSEQQEKNEECRECQVVS